MAKKKYSISDNDGNSIGFVVIEVAPTFEHTSPGPLVDSGPMSDAVLFATVLGGFTAVAWLLPGPDWLAPSVGLSITATLAGLKAWRGSILPSSESPPDNSGVLLKGEFTNTNDGTIHLDEINNDKILISALIKTCVAVRKNNFVWMGRGKMKRVAGVGRTQYELIREEFYTLNYFKDAERGLVVMTGRGRLFIHKVATLPH